MAALNAAAARFVLAGVRAVLFDKDGTLLDFDATWGPATAAVLTALAEGRDERFAALAERCGFLPATRGFAPDSPVIGGYADEFLPAWATLLGEPYDEPFKRRVLALYHATSLASLTGYDDVAGVLESLRSCGYRIGLATNDAEATARAHLEKLGIAPMFAFVAGFDSGFGGKPDAGMVHAFAQAVSVPPDAVALVGDSPHDMQAALAAGAVPVGIARTERALQALGDLPAVTVTDLNALRDALGIPA